MAVLSATIPYGASQLFATSGGVAAAAQGELLGLNWADRAVVVISGLTSETVAVTGKLLNSAVYTGNLRPIDLTTGATAAASALGNGSYEFKDLCFDSLKFTKSSTTEVPVITVFVKGRQY